MGETFLEKWLKRIEDAWGVLIGHYIAVYPEAIDIFMDPEHIVGAALGKSLLHKVSDPLPTGCYCQPGRCMAPRPNWCRDAAKRDARPAAKPESGG